MKAYTGTSGFSYPYWKNRFYPEKLPASQWLKYYSTQFNTVELNHTFYRFPVAKNLRKSADATPDDFRFSVKANKSITHTLRLRNARDKISEFRAIVEEGLGDKLSCILFQLPPSYSYSEEHLNDILSNIGHESRNVIEFRHKSWWNTQVYEIFEKHSLTFCSVSYPGLSEERIVTSDLFYQRMHGVPELFISPYHENQLHDLAVHIPSCTSSFVYFNNTMFEAGYTNAARFKKLNGCTMPKSEQSYFFDNKNDNE